MAQSPQTPNGLQNTNLGNTSGDFRGDSVTQLGAKFNSNNEIILTEHDPLDGGISQFTGLVWDKENRMLSLTLPEGEIFLGSSNGITTQSLEEAIQNSSGIGDLVRFVGDVNQLRSSDLHQDYSVVIVSDSELTEPGDKAYLYSWNENSTNSHNPPVSIRPDSVSEVSPGRWEVLTTIPLDLEQVLLFDNSPTELSNRPVPGSGDVLQSFVSYGDENHPPGVYQWNPDSNADTENHITPSSNPSVGRWVRLIGGVNDPLLRDRNLSDLQDVASARDNLGLGSAAVRDEAYFLRTENNLAELSSDEAEARQNLGLGTAATQDSGEILQEANSLSELSDTANEARLNLGMPGFGPESTNQDAALFRENYFLHSGQNDEALAHITFSDGLTVQNEPIIVDRGSNTGIDLPQDILAINEGSSETTIDISGVSFGVSSNYGFHLYNISSESVNSGTALTIYNTDPENSDHELDLTTNVSGGQPENIIRTSNSTETDLIIENTSGGALVYRSPGEIVRINNNGNLEISADVTTPVNFTSGLGLLNSSQSNTLTISSSDVLNDSNRIDVYSDGSLGSITHVGEPGDPKVLRIENREDASSPPQGEIEADYIEIGEDQQLPGRLRFNDNQIWHEGNHGEGSGLDADLLDGKDSEFFLNVLNFYDKAPEGNRIYVSAATGNDENYGFTREKSVKSIKEAATIAFSLQAPNTLEGNLRRDAVRALERNKSIIVDELAAHAINDVFSNTTTFGRINCQTPRTYRDIRLIYEAITRDVLLQGNQETLRAFSKLFDAYNRTDNEAGSTNQQRELVYQLWAGTAGITGLLERLIQETGLMQRAVDGTLSASDFTQTQVNEADIYNDHVTVDDPSDDPNPCDFILDELSDLLTEFQNAGDETEGSNITKDNLDEPGKRPEDGWFNLISTRLPSQANRKPYSTIIVESGTYYEDIPIYLPDRVTVFGDSLRRVTILPRQEVKQRGSGLHQRILPQTFTTLKLGEESNNVRWDGKVWVVVDTSNSTELRTEEGAKNLIGKEFTQEILVNSFSPPPENVEKNISGTITDAKIDTSFSGSSKYTRFELEIAQDEDRTFKPEPATFDGDGNLESNGRDISIDGDYTGQLELSELYSGYLLLKDSNDNPVQPSGYSDPFERYESITPSITLSRQPAVNLKKGDVLAIYDYDNARHELIRVESHDGTQLNILPHIFNGRCDLSRSYLYLAPRPEWQSLMVDRFFEGGFGNNNPSTRSKPSLELVTDPTLVGQHCFLVGNANYVFQVNFKEHTNFAFAFRGDTPQIYASPYIQNCSSLTTKGGAGILVDGYRPEQPDFDLPPEAEPTEFESTEEFNKRIDATTLLSRNKAWILRNTNDLIQEYEDKCRRDLNFILDAIIWQLPRGGNDRVYDYAEVIRNALERQADKEDRSLQDIANQYDSVLGSGSDFRQNLQTAINASDDSLDYQGKGITGGDCSDIISVINTFLDLVLNIIDPSANNPPKTSNFGEPSTELNKRQNSELRSFVLDAFTQINTFGGFGHLIRNNGYAQLVSTFTTFCDIGVKVESGGLVNLSNSVCDFGWYGLVADGLSINPYLEAKVAYEEVGVRSGRSPTRQIYIDARTVKFLDVNPVFSVRKGGQIQSLIDNYENADSENVVEARDQLTQAVKDAIQLNATFYFYEGDGQDSIYSFDRNTGEHYDPIKQVPRIVETIDTIDRQVSDLGTYKSGLEDPPVPTVRLTFPISQRIPGYDEVGESRESSNSPLVREGTRVKIFITSTITSSGHGFEYVGSGNDYSIALPENGGVPDPDKKTLKTNGGQVFVSSTDVQGNFQVGAFFSVQQRTGTVELNPENLRLINLTQIGPFRNKGILGSLVIKDLTNNADRIIKGGDYVGSKPASDTSTIATVRSIHRALRQETKAINEKASQILAQANSNNKLLEGLRNPKLDLGTWGARHAIFHRDSYIEAGSNNAKAFFEADLAERRNIDTFVAEFGGNFDKSLTEFRNRASYNVNFVVDTSESMASSGRFYQIKQDLINFFYNFDREDAIAIYQSGSSRIRYRYVNFTSEAAITVEDWEGDNVDIEYPANLEESTQGTVSFGGEGNPDSDKASGKIEKVLPKENKALISITKGEVFKGSTITSGSDTLEVASVEPGLAPNLFSIADSPTIVVEQPDKDYETLIRNGLLREVGAVLPTTVDVHNNHLLEPRTHWLREEDWNPSNTDDYFTVYPRDGTNGEWNSSDYGNSFPGSAAAQSLVEGGSLGDDQESIYTFHADPDIGGNNFDYLPPRTTLTTYIGQGVPGDYSEGDVSSLGAYDGSESDDQYLVYSHFGSDDYDFVENIASKPQVDIVFVTNFARWTDRYYYYHNLADQIQSLGEKLREDGLLDYQFGHVAGNRARRSHKITDLTPLESRFGTAAALRDFDREVWNTDALPWYYWSNNGVGEFAPDGGGSPGNPQSDSDQLGQPNEFWIRPTNELMVPLRQGTRIRMYERPRYGTNVNLPVSNSVTEIPWPGGGNCPYPLKAGDRITFHYDRAGNLNDGTHISAYITFTVAQDVSKDTQSEIDVEPKDVIADLGGEDTVRGDITSITSEEIGVGSDHPVYEGVTLDEQGHDFNLSLWNLSSNSGSDEMILEVAEDFVPDESLSDDGNWIKVKGVDGTNSWDIVVDGSTESKRFLTNGGNNVGLEFYIDQCLIGGQNSYKGRDSQDIDRAVATACRETKWRKGSTRVVVVLARRRWWDYTHGYGSSEYAKNHTAVYNAKGDDSERALALRHDLLVAQAYGTYLRRTANNVYKGESRFPEVELVFLYELYKRGQRYNGSIPKGEFSHPNEGDLGDDGNNYFLDDSHMSVRWIEGKVVEDDSDNPEEREGNNIYSNSIVLEELLRAGVTQFHVGTRRKFYDVSPSRYSDSAYEMEAPDIWNYVLCHQPTNFSDGKVRQFLEYTTGVIDEATSMVEAHKDTYNAIKDQLPTGRYLGVNAYYDGSVANLVTDLYELLGEDTNNLYNDVSKGSNSAAMPPGFTEYMDITSSPGEQVFQKWPTPAVMPTPAVSNDVLQNSGQDWSYVPGMTVSGRSSIYESIITAVKDLTPTEKVTNHLLDQRPETKIAGRNPAREGAINVTAVISDGMDNDSFSDLVVRYKYEDNEPKVELEKLFRALFVDKTGRVQFAEDSNQPIQQQFIYTSEVMNLIRSLAKNQVTEGSNRLNLNEARESTYEIGEADDGSKKIEPFLGDQQTFDEFAEIITEAQTDIFDGMGLLIPIYEGGSDADNLLFYGTGIDGSESIENISSLRFFPNPYRMVQIAMNPNEFPGLPSDLPSTAKIFTFLAEEGPDIQISIPTLNISPRVFGRDSEQNVLPNELIVRLHSKLGFLHQNLNIGQEQRDRITAKLAVFDPGFGQKTSAASKVLSQNLGGNGGTIFNDPSTVAESSINNDYLIRDGDVPVFENNPDQSLLQQRLNYINSFTTSGVQSQINGGVPLISRRYLGTNESGEYFSGLSKIDDRIFLNRIDINGNNRDSIFSITSGSLSSTSEEWESEILNLRTGGTEKILETTGFSSNLFGGNGSVLPVIADYLSNGSSVMAKNNNERWITIAEDGKGDIDIPNRARNYFSQILEISDQGALFLLQKDGVQSSPKVYVFDTNSGDFGKDWKLFGEDIDIVEEISDETDNRDGEIFSLLTLPSSENLSEEEQAGVFFWDDTYSLSKDPSVIEDELADGKVDFMGTPVDIRDLFPAGEDPVIQEIGGDTLNSSTRLVWTVYGSPNASSNGNWEWIPGEGDEEGGWRRLTDGDTGAYVRKEEYNNNSTLGGGRNYHQIDVGSNENFEKIAPFIASGEFHLAVLISNSKDSFNTKVSVKHIPQEMSYLYGSGTDRPVWNYIGSPHPYSSDGGTLADNNGFTTLVADVADDGSVEESDNQMRAVDMISIDNNETLIVAFRDEVFGSTNGINTNKLLSYNHSVGEWEEVQIQNSGGTTIYTPGNGNDINGDGGQRGFIDKLFVLSEDSHDYDYGFISVHQQDGENDTPTIFLYLHNTSDDAWEYVMVALGLSDQGENPPIPLSYDPSTVSVASVEGTPSPIFTSHKYPQEQVRSVMDYTDDGGTPHLLVCFGNENNLGSLVVQLNDISSSINTWQNNGADTPQIQDKTSSINLRPLIDPSVYPRYPHGRNWFRDGLIGLNLGDVMSGSTGIREKNNFSWNAPRYTKNNVFSNLENTLDTYQNEFL